MRMPGIPFHRLREGAVSRLCRVFRECRRRGEDDFSENRLRHDLARPRKTRDYLLGGNGTPRFFSYDSYSVCYSLASPADVCFAFMVLRAGSRLSMTDIVMSNSSNISDCSLTSPVLINSFNRSLVSTSAIRFCYDRVLIGDIMNVLHFFGIEADEPEVELFHAGNVRVHGFQYHLIAGALSPSCFRLCCVHINMPLMVESNSVTMFCLLLNATRSPLTFIPGGRESVCGDGSRKGRMRLSTCSRQPLFLGMFQHQFLYVLCLVRNPVSGVTLYQMWDGTGLDKQFDLSHEPESGILLRITRTVVIQLTDTAEFLDDDTVNLTLLRPTD